MIKSIIAAVSENGVIGRENGIPWNYPEDWRHFRKTTHGYPIIAGRKTYESFQIHPLPGRLNIILSHDADYHAPGDAPVYNDLQLAFERAKKEGKGKVFILGGAQIYLQTMPVCEEMIITFIPKKVDGDAFFPEWNPKEWKEVKSIHEGELVFKTYHRA
ncbi:MAG: dihydrofolate reductase [Candidatus Latescibacterota bacterium]|nr:dihydrofolate reductase [Candidatus Latescibacterota bacterium]